MASARNDDLSALLAHGAWARRLARTLVVDAHRADDLVQRAWVAALEAPPRADAPVRRWIALVMRNFACTDARSEARRRVRERSVARVEAVDPELPERDAVDASLAVQEELVRAVRTLREPYRSTIWSRYFEGLPPRDIARRDAVPVKTVKTRLARGLEDLRTELDRRRGGDRSAWLAALVPLAIDRSLGRVALGALLMDAKLKVAGAAVVLVCALGAWFAWDAPLRPEPARASAPSASAPAHEIAPATALASTDHAVADTSRAPVEPTGRNSADAPPVVAPRVTGRVIDLERRGIADVGVVVRDSEDGAVLARSDLRGRFEIEGVSPSVVLLAQDERWVTVYGANISGASSFDDATIVVAPRRPLAGVVLDPAKNPVAGASIAYELGDNVPRDAGDVLHRTFQIVRATKTDERGRFELLDAPLLEAAIVVRAEPWHEASIPAPPAPDYGLEIALQPRSFERPVLRGAVVDRERRGIADTWVVFGDHSTRSLADGRFELEIDLESLRDSRDDEERPLEALELRAARDGRLPARVVVPLADLAARAAAETFELVLGDEALTIEGRVLDADDKPVAGASVELADEEPFGDLPWQFGSEKLTIPTSVEKLLRGGVFVPTPTSGADGRFTVRGLLARDYRLDVRSSERVLGVRTAPISAGARDVVVKLPPPGERVRVAGRVVSLRDEPLPNVEVRAYLYEPANDLEIGGPETTTDASGAFDLGTLPRWKMQLFLSGTSIVHGTSLERGPDGALDALVLVAPRECRVQLDLGAQHDLADKFAILDKAGEPLRLGGLRGTIGENVATQTSWASMDLGIQAGRSEVAAVDERARTLVLYKGDAEIGRRALDLRIGELNVLRP